MIVKPPSKFEYNSHTRTLFLFYQLIMDMTFDFPPDTYKVTVHNTHSLIEESYSVYLSLKAEGCTDKYYKQYLPIIIDEIMDSFKSDKIAQEILGQRYEEYRKVLNDSKSSIEVFEENIGNLRSLFFKNTYYNKLCKRINKVVHTDSYNKELLKLANDWLCELTQHDYSLQHIHQVTKRYFQNTLITSPDAIEGYFDSYTFESKKWDILCFADKKLAEYYCKSLKKAVFSTAVEPFSIVTKNSLAALEKSSQNVKRMKNQRDSVNNYSDRKIAIIRTDVEALDPYKATLELKHFLKSVGNIVAVFDNERKIQLDKIVCLNYEHVSVLSQVNPMDKRNRDISKDYLKKTAAVLAELKMSSNIKERLLKAFSFHNDALLQESSSKYVIIMLWTALESIFASNTKKGNKAVLVKDCLIEIIQRTYIIKVLKYLQADVLQNLRMKKPEIIRKHNIDDIKVFIDTLFDDDSSERVMDIMETLSDNPLLCLRLHILVNEKLRKGGSIKNMLTAHREKVMWQIDRIYRSRNFLIHSGDEFPFNNSLIENLHNYYDFIINYILLKGSSNERVISINSIVSEAKLDNNAHINILKEKKNTRTKDKIYEMLFGPSINVLDYYHDSSI